MSSKIIASYLKSDSVQAIQIRNWLQEYRADRNIDDVDKININMAVKYTGMDGEYKNFEPMNIGAALLTFPEPYEVIYVPLDLRENSAPLD